MVFSKEDKVVISFASRKWLWSEEALTCIMPA